MRIFVVEIFVVASKWLEASERENDRSLQVKIIATTRARRYEVAQKRSRRNSPRQEHYNVQTLQECKRHFLGYRSNTERTQYTRLKSEGRTAEKGGGASHSTEDILCPVSRDCE